MKVWVFVEGSSDVKALSALWSDWKEKLGEKEKGWGIHIIPLENKSKYFKKIGPRATEKLLNDPSDLVVGLPDLYPNRDYANTEYKHDNLKKLQEVQDRLVNKSLSSEKKVRRTDIGSHMARFYSSALKHDLEVLLLAATKQLKIRLGMQNRHRLSGWRRPPEDQNQNQPPKRIVEDLFRKHLGKSYRQNVDSYAILSKANLREVVFDERGTIQCPTFRAMIDWIGDKTGVPGY